MKLTRERKIIGVVLGLAAVALVVDRVTSSPAAPNQPDATDSLLVAPEQRQAAGASSKASPAGSVAGALGAAGAGEVARRLAQISQERNLAAGQAVEAFAPPSSWQVVPVVAAPAGPTTDNRDLEAAQRIFEKHKLMSLVGGGRGGAAAMIDGKYVRLGQSLDGFTLVAVENQAVVFQRAGVQVRLRSAGPMQVARVDDAEK